MKFKLLIVVYIFITAAIYPQNYSQTFISLSNTGVEQFRQQFPEYDGRGTIILVLDTGVDMGVEGLTSTSTGEIKVIDVQDFTGQGEIDFFDAEIEEEDGRSFAINEEKMYKVSGIEKLSLKPVDDEYYIGAFPENIWLNSGSRINDVNENGIENELFHFVTFKTAEGGNEKWVLYFDTDSDNDLSDEKPLTNYKDNLEFIQIKTGDNLPLITIALNIFPDDKMVSFFFDDGSHGTHCAGIAAGNRIGDQNFSGVAPGAKIIGLKIGNNNYSGGATVTESMKKAYLYADRISKERKEPCVINMSYGIGSEVEGHAEMELFLNKLVEENPYLYICKSNDNEGPGISSTGLPSSTPSVFTSGAVLAKEVGNDLYGTSLDRDVILHFSSRGAEYMKPDVVSPGAAASTVPNFSRGDRMWGTSMASPYTAGVVSLLLSAAAVEYPDIKIPSQFLYKVIRESALKLPGYDHVDQGSGYINVNNAWQLLRNRIDAGELNKFETYSIAGFAPHMPGHKSESLYLRNGLYLSGTESYSFSVTRNNFINSKKFYRSFVLASDSDWLLTSQNKLHIRNNQRATVNVSFDKSKMTKPGLYNGKIYAHRDDKTKNPEFELMATVVVPYEFNRDNNYITSWNDITIDPAMHQRYFLRVPAGTSDMRIKINSDANEFTHLTYFLHDNKGRQVSAGILNAEMNEETIEKYYQNPVAGVYELVIIGYFADKVSSQYDLSVEMNGLQVAGDLTAVGEEQHIKVMNVFDKVEEYSISGSIKGYRKSKNVSVNGKESFTLPFNLNKNESGKKFRINLATKDFNKLTDFSIVIYDDKGSALASTSLSYKDAELEIANNFKDDIKKLELKLIPGFVHAESEMNVEICEYTAMKETEDIKIIESRRVFYPSCLETIEFEAPEPAFDLPDGASYWGEIEFKNQANNKVEVALPITVKF
ncbi:MAG: S8 family serine peptidase [Melioribacteraceae bacterium]|nr:S8 family serine peptidase [Melioribacteraceae bacterium]